jgi:hypothetical protein
MFQKQSELHSTYMAMINTWIPSYHSDQRVFDNLHFNIHGGLNINQYTMPHTEQSKQDFGYRHLIARTNEVKKGVFVCWKPDITKPGIDVSDNPDYQYRRFNYFGSKQLCHVFTWQYFHPGVNKPENYDISHLCCDPECCRPTHLYCELRKYQRTRDKCPGFIWYQFLGETQQDGSDEENHYFDLCEHQPKCKKCQEINIDNEIVDIVSRDI